MGINNKYSTPKLIDLSTKRFTLQIDNRLKWTIIGIDKAIPWLERLAEIIKMSPAKALLGNCIIVLKSRKLSTIVPLSLLPKNLAISLPKTGWSNHDQKHCQIWTHPKSKTVVFEINQETTSSINIIRMWTLLDIIYQQIIGKGGFPIHSALVKKRGKGVIIAAHGGTGKSTCCRRIPPPWIGVCDDEVLIVCDQSGRYFAHPCPTWSNFLLKRRQQSNWPIEKAVPVAAFCFLKQSKKDRIEFVGQGQGAICINQHALQISRRSFRALDKDAELKICRRLFENACQAAKTIPSYILEAHKNGKFWEEIDKIL